MDLSRSNAVTRLSLRVPRSHLVGLVAAGTVVVPLVVLYVVATIAAVTDPHFGEMDVAPSSIVWCSLMVAAFPLAYGVMLFGVLRSGWWLEGTTVVRRTPLTVRRVDLALAEVTGDATQRPGRAGPVPVVIARDPATGKSIRLPLTGAGRRRLPPSELTAIADAIMAVRQPGDAGYESAHTLVRAIRELVATSLST